MSRGVGESLQSLVRSKYRLARAATALTFAPSQLAVLDIGGIPFQLRYCPSLAKKPGNRDEKQRKPAGIKIDPFENPTQDLLVAEIPAQDPSHIVVLNKFPIIENHFILATKHNKQQTHRLEADDLAQAHQCLSDWENGPTGAAVKPRLFAFFNSGEHSGASQPHRHIQFVPVEDMKTGQAGCHWTLLADEIMTGNEVDVVFKGPSRGFRTLSSLPFVHFGARLPLNPSAGLLQGIYWDLYEAAAAEVHAFVKCHPGKLQLHSTDDGNLSISYNLAMTTNAMIIFPRRSEGQVVKREDGSDVDFVALNGTVLAGTLMVKNMELFELLQKDKDKLGVVLESIGIPLSHKDVSSQM